MGFVRDGAPVAVFGPFCFDLSTRELRKNGIRLRLEDKPALVLHYLIEHSGSIVTREDLQAQLWPDGVHVDFNHGLNKAINRLRAVLADHRDEPRYVETLSRRGYRFVAQVEFVPLVNEGNHSTPTNSTIIGKDGTDSQLTAEHGLAVVPAELSSLRFHASGAPAIVAIARRVPAPATLLGAAAGLIILAVLGLVSWNHVEAARPSRTVIALPPELRLTNPSEGLGLAVSPDGTQVVFSAVGPENRIKLWLRRLESLAPEPIPGTEDGTFPFWSPDTKNLGFFAGTELKRVSLLDHSVTTLCTVETGRGASWSKDGVILFSPGTRSPIYKINDQGGTPSRVSNLDESRYTTHRWPEFLPDGKHFVYLAANHDKSWAPGAMFLGSTEGGGDRFLGESDSNVATVPGALLFLLHGKLMSHSLDLNRAVLDTHANIIAEAVRYDSGSWYGNFAANSTDVVYSRRQEKKDSNLLAWFDRRGKKLGNAGPAGVYREVSLAPDGGTIAAACGDPDRNICLIHVDGTVTQVTRSGINSFSAWASDSTFFSYFVHRSNTDSALLIKPLDAKTPERVLMAGPNPGAITSWHPDKRHALLTFDYGKELFRYFIYDLATGKTTPYLSSDTNLDSHARFSPDGHWVTYSKQSGGKDQIHITSFPVPRKDYIVTDLAGRGPKWRADGRELYFLGPEDNLYAVSVSTDRGRLTFGTPQLLFHPAIPPAPWDIDSFDVSRDGTRFLVNTVSTEEPPQFVLTTNWQGNRRMSYDRM